MFTDCPSCGRLFRIRASQLGAADGWVRCGYCGQTFYALERLHDAPITDPAPRQHTQETEPKPSPADTEPELAQVETADAEAADELFSELPPALLDYDEKKAGSPAGVIWGGLVVVLSLVALLQLAWFNRDTLLQSYPSGAHWVERICEKLQCEPIRFRDLSTIKLLSKEVHGHPRYRNALLVSAVIVSEARFPQPFPEIELALYAADRQVLARGRFAPADYLAPGVDPAAGMAPGEPVYLALELAGAAEQAVSFQFRFH